MSINTFSPNSKCRCGYDGVGVHQCHAGRDPRYTGGRCPREAKEIPVVTGPAFLPGESLKFNMVFAYYCEECAIESGLRK